MHTVHDLLRGKSGRLLFVSPHTTVFDALTQMALHDVGALVVLENDALVGMFSERDYARKVVLLGHTSKEIAVADIMTTGVVTVSPTHTVRDCMNLMTDKHVRHLPVVDGAHVVGLISIGDVVKAMLGEQEFAITQLERYITT